MPLPTLTRLAPAARALRPRGCVPPLWRELRPPAAQRPASRPPATHTAVPVLLIPGLFQPDRSMDDLGRYLADCGHETWPCGLDRNIDCSEASLRRLEKRLRAAGHGRRAVIVGHSRGGLLGRVLAARAPELVCGVITIGSPHRDQLAVHPALWAALLALGTLGHCGVGGVMRYSCQVGDCCRRFRRDLAGELPPGVALLSIYSRRDGIVDWRQCVPAAGERLEVGCGHRAMPGDPRVLHAVAEAIGRYATR
jgi:pimeloyl-ACP methyl ester carboxylesterase